MACKAADISAEVIVVDNCSSDATFALAEEHADIAFQTENANVGQLRNEGAAIASGSFLLFLDADVELTMKWAESIKDVLEQLASVPSIYGSFVRPPASRNIFLRHWFFHLNSRTTGYLGSANMLIPSTLFRTIGGFDGSLVSGEDSEFCGRARSKGYVIHHDCNLLAVHHGYPTTARAFVRREWWHGSGDSAMSKVKVLSFTFLGFHVALLFSITVSRWDLVAYSITAITLECLFSTLVKFRFKGVKTILVNTLIFYLYFWGRSLSLFFPKARVSNR